MSFAPDPKDDRELGLYFGAGPNPNLKWTPKAQRDRRAKVEAALDGRGYHLQRYYRGDLSADEPELAQDYTDWARRFHARGRPPKVLPHCVLTDSEVERLLTRYLPERREIQRESGRWVQPVLEAEQDQLGDVAELESRNLIERATWFGWRVAPEGARELLRLSHWLDGQEIRIWIRRLDDDAALAALRARLALLPNLPVEEQYHEPQNRNLTPEEREDVRWALATVGGQIDPRRHERIDRDAAWTTVTEIADRHVVQRSWTRDTLVSLGCPGAAVDRARLPTQWFATQAGLEFWRRLAIEEPRRRKEILEGRARRVGEVVELKCASTSLDRLDSCRPAGRTRIA